MVLRCQHTRRGTSEEIGSEVHGFIVCKGTGSGGIGRGCKHERSCRQSQTYLRYADLLMSLLSCSQPRQLYRVESPHRPVQSTVATVLRDTINSTVCILQFFFLFTFLINLLTTRISIWKTILEIHFAYSRNTGHFI